MFLPGWIVTKKPVKSNAEIHQAKHICVPLAAMKPGKLEKIVWPFAKIIVYILQEKYTF